MEQNANALPKVTLGQYKGLDFTRRVRPVSEKAVELEASNLTRTHAPFVPVELPAARGMRVTLDFEGFLDGVPIPDSRMENVTVVLGTGQLMPAAENAVYGHKAGENFRFDFTYPAEFRVPELSGKTAQFAIALHTVEQKQTVPLDDAFAGTLGFDSVDALKESIREKKRRSHEANADRIAGAALLDMAGANLTAELNDAILDQNAERDMNALRDRLRRSKMTMELYCKAGQTTPDGVRAAFRRDAPYGRVVTNPPYGERILEKREAEELYRAFGRAVCTLPEGWRVSVLSSHTEFERTFGRTADKKRKLYNGMLKCDLFQYGR